MSRSSAAGSALSAIAPWHFATRQNRRLGAAARKAASRPCAAGLRDQTLAALGAARGQNLASVGGFHAGAKTVGTGALEHAGLIGAFHGVTPRRMPAQGGSAWKKTGNSRVFMAVRQR